MIREMIGNWIGMDQRNFNHLDGGGDTERNMPSDVTGRLTNFTEAKIAPDTAITKPHSDPFSLRSSVCVWLSLQTFRSQ